ncbi:hypothetical protein HY450_00940 [Candidatus Pacearchaeota archaeon]|nr:hypothetical protein [Candidatus Pacearchaeota archaeon]
MTEQTKSKTEEKKKIEVKPSLSPQQTNPEKREEVQPKSEPKVKAKPLPVETEKAGEMESERNENKEAEKKRKPDEKPKIKKEEAIARGNSLPISMKQGANICKFIKNKSIDRAISDLNEVIKLKKPIPFKGETPHRKNLSSPGRYPVKASGYFIKVLKALKGNVIVNNMELEKTRIVIASASWARRPPRSGGRSAKRTNILLKAKEVQETNR